MWCLVHFECLKLLWHKTTSRYHSSRPEPLWAKHSNYHFYSYPSAFSEHQGNTWHRLVLENTKIPQPGLEGRYLMPATPGLRISKSTSNISIKLLQQYSLNTLPFPLPSCIYVCGVCKSINKDSCYQLPYNRLKNSCSCHCSASTTSIGPEVPGEPSKYIGGAPTVL